MTNAVSLKGSPVLLEGTPPELGEQIPEFTLVGQDLADVTLDDFAGKRKILNIFPSIDTPTCAASVRAFNRLAASQHNTVVINISADLPFAQSRFCATEGLDHVVNLSTLRGRDMLKNYGVLIVTSLLAGLASRAVIVTDADNIVKHIEIVAEISLEPDYDAAIAALM
jgi:thioredoxin-dependent peroxiredoxin